jgi:hypothetical protein
VGADLGGIREFMTEGGMGALLFAPDNPDALACAVQRAVAWSGPKQPEVMINGMTELARRMEATYRDRPLPAHPVATSAPTEPRESGLARA